MPKKKPTTTKARGGATRRKGKAEKPVNLICMGDIHGGSEWAICPPDYMLLSEGRTVRLNSVQQFLWEARNALIEDLTAEYKGERLWVIFNGDGTEGIHHGGREVVSKDWGDHVDIAVESVKPIAELCERVFVTLGTECHTMQAEQRFAKELGAGRAVPHHKFILNDHLVSATHHISTTSRGWLEHSGLGLNAASEIFEAARNRHRVPDIIIRSHRHKAGDANDQAAQVIVTNPWQGLTRHGHKVVPGAVSVPGAYVLDYRHCTRPKEFPWVRRFNYAPPEQEVAQ